MKFGVMWSDTFKSLFKRPVTQKYPFVRLDAPERLRSKLHWDPTKCTGCALCSKDCPAEAIEIITIDKKAKRFVFKYQIDACTFCAQCVESCKQACLEMANDEWELAALSRDAFTVYYGNDADVETVLVGAPAPEAPTPADS
jgi:formate hydrogenlyase subunit 6/NADH:ubiquinone oxidoreductase subunit I